jgi:hypothetical protein
MNFLTNEEVIEKFKSTRGGDKALFKGYFYNAENTLRDIIY